MTYIHKFGSKMGHVSLYSATSSDFKSQGALYLVNSIDERTSRTTVGVVCASSLDVLKV